MSGRLPGLLRGAYTQVAYLPPVTPTRVLALARAPSLQRAVCGRRVLVTGASSGIGRETARRLARAGATVLLVARTEPALREVVDELTAAGLDAHALPCDLADPEANAALVAEVVARWGGVDVLVNNAGLSLRRSIARSSPVDYERTMRLNYFGALHLTLGLLGPMVEQGRGHVVNHSTMGVQASAPRFAAYLASKSALDQFGRCLAQETRHTGVRVTAIHLPLVRTPMIAPTAAYAEAASISVGQATDLVAEAIRTRPARVVPTAGLVLELARIATPPGVERAMNLAYRASRASEAEARGEDVGGGGALPRRLAATFGIKL